MLKLELKLNARLTGEQVHVVYALAPALVAFFVDVTGGVGGKGQLPEIQDLAQMRRSGWQPVLPEAVTEAVCAGPGIHVGDRLVMARQALRGIGYHLPPLDHVILNELTLGEWLELSSGWSGEAVRVQRDIEEKWRAIDGLMQEVTQLANKRRRLMAMGVLHVGS